MARVSRGTRTGTALAAGLLAGTALTGCGNGGNGGDGGGSPTETGTDRGKDAAEVVRTAHESTLEAGTAQLTLEVRADAGGRRQAVTGHGAVDLTDGTSELTVEAGGERIEQRVVDQTLYQRLPESLRGEAPGGKPWIEVDLREAAGRAGTVNGLRIGNPAQAVDYTRALSDEDAARVGTEEIDGVETTRYRVTVDVGELADGGTAEGERLRQQLGDSLPMHLWLDDENRIRRQQFDVDLDNAPAGASKSPGSRGAGDARIRTVIELGDFGTEVDVSPPPAGKTEDVTDEIARQSGRSPNG